jgi:type II secretory pathway pseudopilin PulG
MLRKRNALTIVEGIVVFVILLLLVAFLLPSVRSAREPARRNACLNNLKQIGLALHNYHDKHGHFPPAYTVDEQGNRLHSWRTLILPFMEESSLYDSIDLSKSWDDPANAKARESLVDCYECPSTGLELGFTTYLAPVGPDWAFAGEGTRTLDEFADGVAKTILFVEVDQKRAVHWMSPFDFEEADGLPFDMDTQGAHPGVNLATFADGHVASIKREIDPEVLRGMLTIAGADKFEED